MKRRSGGGYVYDVLESQVVQPRYLKVEHREVYEHEADVRWSRVVQQRLDQELGFKWEVYKQHANKTN